MSRAKNTEVSSPISLFPFIGVLISTMGALLVVLIAVSRSAHDTAVREVAAQKTAASADVQQGSREKLEQVNQYLARLNEIRTEAQKRLHDDRLRLSHVEDHMRRLKGEVAKLQESAMELMAVEGEHIDDRKQGEREVERLGQLIASTTESIAAIKEELKSKKRSYSIIPYEGPHGTQRRPIYIECRKDEVLLQPEGIQLTPQDFRPPLGAGNPLAAALRAAREYIVREDGSQSKETEPYPLILVRPEGILAYYRVREAIESWDAAFGYELIDDDWALDFPSSNPVLAEIEHQAVEQSRTRQQMLVAAAPRAYGDRRWEADDEFDSEEGFGGGEGEGEGEGEYSGEGGGGFEGGGTGRGGEGGGRAGDYAGTGGPQGSGSQGPYPVGIAENGETGEFFGDGIAQVSGGGPGGTGEPIGNGAVGIPSAGPGVTADGAMSNTGGGNSGGGSGEGSASASGTAGGATPIGQEPGNSTSIIAGTAEGDGSSIGAAPPAPVSATGSSLASGMGEANLMAGNRTASGGGVPGETAGASTGRSGDGASLAMQMNKPQYTPAHARGQNWAIKGKAPSSVPIRRTIRVVVRGDRLAIQPDSRQANQSAIGQEIPLPGPTAANLDEFVAAVQDRVHEWGIAGNGLYWRPVLLLDVGAGGQARADDLARLLRNSGIELMSEATANRSQEGQPNATR